MSNISIEELEEFFKSADLPQTIQLYQGVKIIDCKVFVETALYQARRYGKNPTFGTAYTDLVKLKELLEAK